MSKSEQASIFEAIGDGMNILFHVSHVKYICITRQVYDVSHVSYIDKLDVKLLHILHRGVTN